MRTAMAQYTAISVQSFYVGPGYPPVRISQWADLVAAVQSGTLAETQWVELKAAIPASTSAANLEVARDLASLSVDGGLLVVGVKDPGTKAEHIVGTTDGMEGLKSRLGQIAGSTRIQPPLHVSFVPPIVIPADSTRAVLLVTVPASASAPHMVDEKYWGRGATGKRPLSDVEIDRLMTERRRRRDDFVEKLRSLPEPSARQNGHRSVMAEPAVGLAGPSVTEVATGQHPRQLVTDALSFSPQWRPSFESLRYVVDHPDGLALASWEFVAETPDEKDILYLLVTDGGAVRVASGRGTCPYGRDGDQIGIASNHIIEIVHQTLALAAHVGKSYLRYSGIWNVGVHLNGIAGRLPLQAFYQGHWDFRPSPFQTPEYTRTSSASTEDLADRTSSIVEVLLADLARGLGLRNYLFPYTNPAEIGTKM
jgi:hypothetical protein